MPNYDACPICRAEGMPIESIESAVPRRHDGRIEERTYAQDGLEFQCPTCGHFVIGVDDADDFPAIARREQWDCQRLSSLVREHTTRAACGRPWPILWLRCTDDRYGDLTKTNLSAVTVAEFLAKWPRTASERLDRILCNLARMSHHGGEIINLKTEQGKTGKILFASNPKEEEYHVEALESLGRIERSNLSPGLYQVCVTPNGWDRFEQLTHGESSPENPVFVAMWFGTTDLKQEGARSVEAMTRVYMEGIKPAIEQAGYRVTRVDFEEFNDGIMDQVLGDIRLAPFVVADFTGHRNGVYLEAGFARGLGRPVIHTCAKDHFENAHFDIKHVNHICWEDVADLKNRLYNRIRGTIGLGPHA